jgi:hypothetical protein
MFNGRFIFNPYVFELTKISPKIKPVLIDAEARMGLILPINKFARSPSFLVRCLQAVIQQRTIQLMTPAHYLLARKTSEESAPKFRL